MTRLMSAVATSLLILVATPAQVPAQGRSCEDLYASMMRNYERGSPRYMERRQQYAQQCQSGGGPRYHGGGRGGGGDCRELRAACLNKDRLGEQGEGNCRRYRESCRGR